MRNVNSAYGRQTFQIRAVWLFIGGEFFSLAKPISRFLCKRFLSLGWSESEWECSKVAVVFQWHVGEMDLFSVCSRREQWVCWPPATLGNASSYFISSFLPPCFTLVVHLFLRKKHCEDPVWREKTFEEKKWHLRGKKNPLSMQLCWGCLLLLYFMT